jgi:hypothetical protein
VCRFTGSFIRYNNEVNLDEGAVSDGAVVAQETRAGIRLANELEVAVLDLLEQHKNLHAALPICNADYNCLRVFALFGYRLALFD